MIVNQLGNDHSKIALLNRAQLLDDAFTLAKVKKIPYSTALDLTLYLKNEREYVPWRSVLDELDYIDIMLHKSSEASDWIVLNLIIIEFILNVKNVLIKFNDCRDT